MSETATACVTFSAAVTAGIDRPEEIEELMRNVDLSLVADYTMPMGMGRLDTHRACFVAQANMLDALSRGESITELSDCLQCACPVLRVLGIALNDGKWWKNDEERTETLRPLLPLLLDSRRSPAITAQRAKMASEFASFAAKYAAEFAMSAMSAEFAKSAAMSAMSAAKYAAEFAMSAMSAEFAKSAAEFAMSAEFAAEFAKSLRDELLRVWKAMEAIQEVS